MCWQRFWAKGFQGGGTDRFDRNDIDCFIRHDRAELLGKACAPDEVTYDTATTCLSHGAPRCLEYTLKHLKVVCVSFYLSLTRFQVDPSKDADIYEARCGLPGTSLACMKVVSRLCPQMFPLVTTEREEW